MKHYYRVPDSTTTGQKLSKLCADISEVETAAERLAKELGAVAWSPSNHTDFGGISLLEFGNGRNPDKGLYEFVKEEIGHKWYAPKVDVEESIYQSDVAVGLKNSPNTLVRDKEMPFLSVSHRFSRAEAAQMAGIEIGFRTKEELPALDEEIAKALSGVTFRQVARFTGKRKAVSLYKKIIALPTIPYGLSNAIMEVRNEEYRIGLFRVSDATCVVASSESKAEGVEEIDEELFRKLTANV